MYNKIKEVYFKKEICIMNSRTKGLAFKYRLIYTFTYGGIGVLIPLVGQYLKGLGFTGTEIGTITGLGTFVAMISTAFWGRIYAGSRDGKMIISGICLGAAVLSIVNLQLTSFALFTAGYMAMNFFQGATSNLADTRLLGENLDFPSIRLFGAIGYSLAAFVGGKIGEDFGLGVIFVIYGVLFGINTLFFAILPSRKKAGEATALDLNVRKAQGGIDESQPLQSKEVIEAEIINNLPKKKYTYMDVFINREMRLIIISSVFIFGSSLANNMFFGFLYRDGGGSIAGIGVVFLVMVGSEAPFMWIGGKLAERFPLENLIVFATGVAIFRSILCSIGPGYQILFVMGIMQGFINGILLVQFLRYISFRVEKEMLDITCAAYYALGHNCGTILCSFLGGIIMDYLGGKGVYGLFAVFNIVGLVIFFWSRKEGKNEV